MEMRLLPSGLRSHSALALALRQTQPRPPMACAPGSSPDVASFHNRPDQSCSPDVLYSVVVPVAIAISAALAALALWEFWVCAANARRLALNLFGGLMALIGAMIALIIQNGWYEGVCAFLPFIIAFVLNFLVSLSMVFIGPIYAIQQKSLTSFQQKLRAIQIGTILLAAISGSVLGVLSRHDNDTFNVAFASLLLIIGVVVVAYVIYLIVKAEKLQKTIAGVIDQTREHRLGGGRSSNNSSGLEDLLRRLVRVKRIGLAGLPLVALGLIPYPLVFFITGTTPVSWLYLLGIVLCLWLENVVGLVLLHKPSRGTKETFKVSRDRDEGVIVVSSPGMQSRKSVA